MARTEISAYEAGQNAARKRIKHAKAPANKLTPSRADLGKYRDAFRDFMAGFTSVIKAQVAQDGVWDSIVPNIPFSGKDMILVDSNGEEVTETEEDKAWWAAKVASLPPEPEVLREPEESATQRRLSVYIGKSEAWCRGYLAFEECSLTRTFDPATSDPDEFREYAAGWERSRADWDANRSFPETVEVQISRAATIRSVKTGNEYHLPETAIHVAQRVNRLGELHFKYGGVKYSVYPSKKVQYVA